MLEIPADLPKSANSAVWTAQNRQDKRHRRVSRRFLKPSGGIHPERAEIANTRDSGRWGEIEALNYPVTSPPSRGNQSRAADFPRRRRTIPAYAGEPQKSTFGNLRKAVYPRLCGGTLRPAAFAVNRLGLSPPMRGNQGRSGSVLRSSRTIPAYAGEPVRQNRARVSVRDYPRLCGGTPPASRNELDYVGLSPPMRGNLYLA